MAGEKFPPVRAGQPITDGRMNRLGSVAQRVAGMRPGQGMSGWHTGALMQFNAPAQIPLATLKVTDDTDAPVYVGVLRQYDFQTGTWSDGTKGWQIDAGALDTRLAEGQIVTAYYDRKRSMFLPAFVALMLRWGKLDGAMTAGSQVDVSLWQGTDGDWGKWDVDSGEDWEDVYAPPVLQTDSIDAGKWVLVGIVNGRRVALLHEC